MNKIGKYNFKKYNTNKNNSVYINDIFDTAYNIYNKGLHININNDNNINNDRDNIDEKKNKDIIKDKKVNFNNSVTNYVYKYEVDIDCSG